MDEQINNQGILETQKSFKKWFVLIPLVIVVVAGVFLYSYLVFVQNDRVLDREGQKTVKEKVIVYAQRTSETVGTSTNVSGWEVVVADTDGTNKKSLGDLAVLPDRAFLSSTYELVYSEWDGGKVPAKIVVMSLADGSKRTIFEANSVYELRLSRDRKTIGFITTEEMYNDVGSWLGPKSASFVTIPLENTDDVTIREMPLLLEQKKRSSLREVYFWDSRGRLVVGLEPSNVWCPEDKDIWHLITLDENGQQIPSPYDSLNAGFTEDDVSSDEKWVAFVHHRVGRASDDPNYIEGVHDNSAGCMRTAGLSIFSTISTDTPIIVEEELDNSYNNEGWTRDSEVFLYSWYESRLITNDTVRGEFRGLSTNGSTRENLSVSEKRYAAFDVLKREKYVFTSRAELNEWLKKNHPTTDRYEIISDGNVQTSPYMDEAGRYRIVTTGSELQVDGIPIERTENGIPIHVFGFSEI